MRIQFFHKVLRNPKNYEKLIVWLRYFLNIERSLIINCFIDVEFPS